MANDVLILLFPLTTEFILFDGLPVEPLVIIDIFSLEVFLMLKN